MGEGVKPEVADIRVGDDVVVIISAPAKSRSIAKGLWDAKWLVALDRQSGQQLWRREAAERFNSHAFAVGGGCVFCIDSLSPAENASAERRGDPPKETAATLLALDARTGDVQWTVNGARLTFAQLEAMLAAEGARILDPDAVAAQPVLIRCDRSVHFEYMQRLMLVLSKHKLAYISLATMQES